MPNTKTRPSVSSAARRNAQAAASVPLAPAAALPSRRPRTDGVDARERLLQVALRLFAEQGFANTSTRDIAKSAAANIAAISYYFGDKAGLYRAASTEPLGKFRNHAIQIDQPNLSLREALHGFFTGLLAPMQQGDLVQLCTRLHFREMLEPTGVWADKIDNGIKPAHAALVRVLCRHLQVRRADDDLHRLAFSIAGLALQVFMTRDVINAIRPKLLTSPRAIDAWCERLVDFADAMVTQEAARRAGHAANLTQKAI